MTLTLTSCRKVREPGFSASECLNLAARIDNWDIVLCDENGMDLPEQHAAMIVAALRAYAVE